MLASEVQTSARGRGISVATLRRAKAALKIKVEKGKEKSDPWCWSIHGGTAPRPDNSKEACAERLRKRKAEAASVIPPSKKARPGKRRTKNGG